jgi:hypothetical protein
MRIRSLALALVLASPVTLSAQRIPLMGRRLPAELPPQPGVIARDMAYHRMNYSVESYPMVTHIVSPGFTGNSISSWTTVGGGSRVDYRILPNVAATLDVTSSFLGGPAVMGTAEMGLRLRPDRTMNRRVYPFVDVRGGFTYAYNKFYSDVYAPFGTPTSVHSAQYAQGFGVVGGGGAEFAISQTLSATAAAAIVRDRMHAFSYGSGLEAGNGTFSMTMYRYWVGFRYNPGRWLQAMGADLK